MWIMKNNMLILLVSTQFKLSFSDDDAIYDVKFILDKSTGPIFPFVFLPLSFFNEKFTKNAN